MPCPYAEKKAKRRRAAATRNAGWKPAPGKEERRRHKAAATKRSAGWWRRRREKKRTGKNACATGLVWTGPPPAARPRRVPVGATESEGGRRWPPKGGRYRRASGLKA